MPHIAAILKKYINPHCYIRKLFRISISVFLFFISPFFRRVIDRAAQEELKYQPVFIIGAPRTGSTILYQGVTNYLDVIYIDNLSEFFFKNIFIGFWLSNIFYRQNAHNCFKSSLGSTRKSGLRAPSECGSFWYRWLPREKHYIEKNDFNDNTVYEIRRELSAIINYYNKPLIINNNNMALRIQLVKKVFPDASFIVTERNPVEVSASLLEARNKIFKDYNTWWSMMPKNYDDLIKKSAGAQVVQQYYYINKQMFIDLSEYYCKENIIIIRYCEFCEDPEKIIRELSTFIKYNKYRFKYKPVVINKPNETLIPQKIQNILMKNVDELDWDDYKS
jgi:hypothetical protein